MRIPNIENLSTNLPSLPMFQQKMKSSCTPEVDCCSLLSPFVICVHSSVILGDVFPKSLQQEVTSSDLIQHFLHIL